MSTTTHDTNGYTHEMGILQRIRDMYYGRPEEPAMSEYDRQVEEYRKNEFRGKRVAPNISKSLYPYTIGDGEKAEQRIREIKFRRTGDE